MITPSISKINAAFIAAILVVLITIFTSIAVKLVSNRVGDSIDKAEQELNQVLSDLDKKVEERTKELQMKNQELSDFSYSITHDLRAPLRAMQGFSIALREDFQDSISEKGIDMANRISKAAIKKANRAIVEHKGGAYSFVESSYPEWGTDYCRLTFKREPYTVENKKK